MEGREQGLGAEYGEPKKAGRPPRSHDRVREMPDERLSAEREAADRDMTQDRELTDDDRLEMFRDSMQQSVLPDLPYFPGYHTFWATTTNPRDSLQRRIMWGYRPIRVEECPGWDGVGAASVGGVEGVVSVNEMVGMRIPLSLYNKYMNEVHHDRPLSEEEKLRSQLEAQAETARRMGSRLEVGEGNAALVQRAEPPPRFTR